MLVRPLTSSALFNAVNAAVSKQPDSLERVLQSTNFDELRAQWLAGVRVLVVDDSDINLEVAQRILEKQGAIVTTCSDGLAALEHVRAHHQTLDVVLMDVQMPTLDGNEATRRIRGELQLMTLPIVALTAGALVGERQRALEAGPSGTGSAAARTAARGTPSAASSTLTVASPLPARCARSAIVQRMKARVHVGLVGRARHATVDLV